MRAQFNEDIHSYDFPDGITITFEKLREEKTGLTAKGIYYFVRSPDDFDVLDSGNINFDASPTRKTQAKTLFGKHSSISLDEWHNRLLTVQRESEKYFYNGGVDVFDLSTVEPDLDSNPALLAPFIAKSGITLIYADSSAGKSMLQPEFSFSKSHPKKKEMYCIWIMRTPKKLSPNDRRLCWPDSNFTNSRQTNFFMHRWRNHWQTKKSLFENL